MSGKATHVGRFKIHRDERGRIVRVGGLDVHYENDRIVGVGGLDVHYKGDRMERVGGLPVQYDENGLIAYIGGLKVCREERHHS